MKMNIFRGRAEAIRNLVVSSSSLSPCHHCHRHHDNHDIIIVTATVIIIMIIFRGKVEAMVTRLLGKLFLLFLLPALNLGQKVGIFIIIAFIMFIIITLLCTIIIVIVAVNIITASSIIIIVISTQVGSYKENTHLKLDIEECTGVENCKKGITITITITIIITSFTSITMIKCIINNNLILQ